MLGLWTVALSALHLTVSVVLFTYARSIDDWFWQELVCYFALGVASVAVSLLILWGTLGTTHVLIRTVAVFAVIALFVWLTWHFREETGYDGWHIVVMIGFMAGVMLLLIRLCGFGITTVGRFRSSFDQPKFFQFHIRDCMLAVVVVACVVLISAGSSASFFGMLHNYWGLWLAVIGTLTAVVIPLAILLPRLSVVRIALPFLAVSALLLVLWGKYAFSEGQPYGQDFFIVAQCSALVAAQSILLAIYAYLFRAVGMRIIHRTERSEHNAAQHGIHASPPSADTSE